MNDKEPKEAETVFSALVLGLGTKIDLLGMVTFPSYTKQGDAV